MAGVETLVNDLLNTTNQQKYIGEEIPEVWLKFEKEIKSRSSTFSLLDYTDTSDIAANCGITDQKEVEQCIQFLNDLGILQYFDRNGLKDKVVINPQVNLFINAFNMYL